MRDYNFIKNKFSEKHTIDNSEFLDKYIKLMIEAAKKGWVNLKNNEDKYEKWRKGRSNHMKKLLPEEQRRRANIFWENISDDRYLKFSQKIKDYWTEEKRIEKSKQMNDYYSNPYNILKKSIVGKKRWDSMDENEREEFNKTMNVVNKDADKRKKAGDKIKSLWKSEDYLNKMKNRKHRSGSMIKIIKPNGEEIIMETMKKLEREYSFSTHLIRKYRDTDNRISEKDLSEYNLILLNSIIKSIK